MAVYCSLCVLKSLVSRVPLVATLTGCSSPVSVHGDSPGMNTGVGCRFLLQGIFPTQGWNPGLQRCGQILYHRKYQESPKTLERVAYPFSQGNSQPRNGTRGKWQPTPVLLPRKPHGRRSLVQATVHEVAKSRT